MALRSALVILLVVLFCCRSSTAPSPSSSSSSSACPCQDPSLCDPIKGFPQKEVLGFVTSETNWPGYNWTLLTTVALFTGMNYSMLCYAHSKDVRVVLSASYDTSELNNVTKVKEWINQQLTAVQTQYADGLNIDIEGELQKTVAQQQLLNQLVSLAVTAFKAANSDYQVTFDVAWSPHCIDGRCYDFTFIGNTVDFIVVMSYDERSQIFGACTASANSPLAGTFVGLELYLELGIPLDKVVLGLPWYGYDYPCVSLVENVCTIPKVPFRGANCSDAAGTQRGYADIRKLLRSSTSFVQWNGTLESPFFNYKAMSGEYHQVWFDDTESLTLKYTYASRTGVHGLAFWNVDQLEYNGTAHDDFLTREMWTAILAFFED